MRPSAILFDLGGTLLRQTRYAPLAWTTRLRELSGDNGFGVETLRETARQLHHDAVAARKTSLTEIPMWSLLRNLHDQFGVRIDLPADELELEFWKATSEMSPEPGVRETLEALSSRDTPLAVVSNSMFTAEVLRWELKRHDLLRWFDFVISSADYAFKKPHASIFRAALRRLQQQPAGTWFVGDSLTNDVAGATSVGMQAVWYNRLGRASDEPHEGHEINSWHELLTLLDESV